MLLALNSTESDNEVKENKNLDNFISIKNDLAYEEEEIKTATTINSSK